MQRRERNLERENYGFGFGGERKGLWGYGEYSEVEEREKVIHIAGGLDREVRKREK